MQLVVAPMSNVVPQVNAAPPLILSSVMVGEVKAVFPVFVNVYVYVMVCPVPVVVVGLAVFCSFNLGPV